MEIHPAQGTLVHVDGQTLGR